MEIILILNRRSTTWFVVSINFAGFVGIISRMKLKRFCGKCLYTHINLSALRLYTLRNYWVRMITSCLSFFLLHAFVFRGCPVERWQASLKWFGCLSSAPRWIPSIAIYRLQVILQRSDRTGIAKLRWRQRTWAHKLLTRILKNVHTY